MPLNEYSNLDTIVAISTPIGEGGIGIVRLSGQCALAIADQIFFSKEKIKPSRFKTYSAHYGWVKDKQKTLDEVILTVMRAPRSYTKEDVVEINCHSGIVPLKKILDLTVQLGARLAEAGEFTKRAYLNGRIDLTQAEAVLDIIRAKTEESLSASFEQLSGCLTREISRMRGELVGVLTELEVKIDFPEDVVSGIDSSKISTKIEKALAKLNALIDNSFYGKVLRDGVSTVICGCPNVGKSSLLNLLLREEKAIVTAVAGTTRDAIEDVVNIRGIPIRIFDTAGLMSPRDVIEDLAIKKTHSLIAEADLVMVVLDGSRALNKEDLGLIKRLKDKIKIGVVNKLDLKPKINLAKVKGVFNKLVKVSCASGRGLADLEKAVEQLIWAGKVVNKNKAFFTNTRHTNLLRECAQYLEKAKVSAESKFSLEIIAQDLKSAIESLDKITGQSVGLEVLEKIFSEFCIGK